MQIPFMVLAKLAQLQKAKVSCDPALCFWYGFRPNALACRIWIFSERWIDVRALAFNVASTKLLIG
jgi:hypothetical protein